MDRPFNDDDRDKNVVTSDGQRIGRVSDVDEHGRATVDHSQDDDSLTDEIMEFLGWDEEEEHHELRQDQVERYDDNELHLRPRR